MSYVVSTAASPNGPFRFNVMAQGLVSVFNTTSRTEVTAAQTDPNVRRTAPLNLNQGINLGTTPAPQLFMTNPVAMAWRPNGTDAWVVIQNSDIVVRLTLDGNGIPTVNNPLVAGPSTLVRVDLENIAANQIPGNAPRGIAINSTGTRAYVANLVSRSITILDISNATAPTIAGTLQSTQPPTAGTLEATLQLGGQLFYSGRGPLGRMSAASWGACIVCHPNGRSDNITWMFDTGPRQTIPLDGTFSRSNPTDQRILNWSAVRDEVHDFELNTRNIFGGRGLIDDDRLFFAIGGTSGATPTDSALLEQFQQFTGVVGTTGDLTGGSPLPSLNTFGGGRRDFGLATLGDGRMFIIGGRSGAGQGALVGAANAVIEFNPRKKGFIPHSATGFTPRHSLGVVAVHTSRWLPDLCGRRLRQHIGHGGAVCHRRGIQSDYRHVADRGVAADGRGSVRHHRRRRDQYRRTASIDSRCLEATPLPRTPPASPTRTPCSAFSRTLPGRAPGVRLAIQA